MTTAADERVVALVVGPSAADAWDAPATPRAAIVGAGVRRVVDLAEVPGVAVELERERPRWVWWSAAEGARPLVDAGLDIARAWDVAEAHRLLAGGWEADPGRAWACAHGLDPQGLPAAHRGDLLDLLAVDTPVEADTRADQTVTDGATGAAGADSPVRSDGYLRADAAAGTWAVTDDRLLTWAETVLQCARAQRERAESSWPRLVATVHAESAAALLCEELRRDGLPIDRAALLDVVGPMSRPAAERDAAVLAHAPGREHTDLRNPAAVKDLLRAVGIDVPSTRKHVLEEYAQVHPLVPALLHWRAEERIATTYGLRWIEEHVGADDRLRGRWRACDGGAGRMTADGGLHSIPAVLRPGVAAHEGYALVRADLGQIEPRVLAVVSQDPAFIAATQADDLYAPVAQRLGVERSIAKVAVLSAMYGGRAGQAAAALRGLEREYPVAMGLLGRTYDAGVRGEPVRTYGGRLIPTSRLPVTSERTPERLSERAPGGPGTDEQVDAARGRFARNAIIQGSAAEFFKAWAATVRATTAHLGARIVLCLHDELLVHVPREHADEAAALVESALTDAARRWSGGTGRFVADTTVISRWSEAKDPG